MDLAGLIVFGTALFLAAASPGPGIAAIVARVLGHGPAKAAVFAVGVALGDLVWLSFAVGGLAVLAQTFYWLFLTVKWAGICYLLYIAWKMWHAPVKPITGGKPTDERPTTLLLGGLSVTMGNPKTMVFYLALLPTLVDLTRLSWLGFVELTGVVALVLAVVFGVYILLAARARRMLASPERLRRMHRGSALAMCGAAGWVATR